jgi:hypothetical protein
VETDRLKLNFKLPVRFVPGANEAAGKVSLYRGPLLLAFDQAQNAFDEDAVPPVDLRRLEETRLVQTSTAIATLEAQLRPWLTVEVPTADGRVMRLVDFASAGAAGTRYRSWMPAKSPPPPPAFTQMPADAARVSLGPVLFQWRGPRSRETSYRVEFSSDAAFASGAAWSTNVATTRVALDSATLSSLRACLKTPPQRRVGARGLQETDESGFGCRPGALTGRVFKQALSNSASTPVYWRVVSKEANGETIADVPPAWFRIDASAPPQVLPPEPKLAPGGELVVHSLRGDAAPQVGELKSAKFSRRDGDGTEVNGRDQMLVYSVPSWPEEDFSVSLRVSIKEHPPKRIGQVFSAWAGGMDDPLRIVVDGGKLFARVEAGGGFGTPGTPIEAGRWYAVAAVKRGAGLTLYVDGKPVGSCGVPEFMTTQAQDCALGGNPHFTGNEFLAARFADFRFYARALSNEEIQALAAAR